MSGIGPIATLPQEFMSTLPPKTDKPEPTRMTHSRRLIESGREIAGSIAYLVRKSCPIEQIPVPRRSENSWYYSTGQWYSYNSAHHSFARCVARQSCQAVLEQKEILVLTRRNALRLAAG